MFLIKLVSHTPKGEIVEVHQAVTYRYEPDYESDGTLLRFVSGEGAAEEYILSLDEMSYSEAFVMNDSGKTIEIIRATREPKGIKEEAQ